jgi:hypothetical protein
MVIAMFKRFDPKQTEQFFNEANDNVAIVSTIMANEASTLTSNDVYDLVERLERARNLLLTVGDRKHIDESKDVA